MIETLPFRRSCRGLLLDGDRVLLAHHTIGTVPGPDATVWVGPGGGVEPDETLEQALARELHEETGLVLDDEHAPRLVWVQTIDLPEWSTHGYAGVVNHYFLLRVAAFEPASGVAPGADGHPDDEGILDLRWWSLDEIDDAGRRGTLFSPRALPSLLRDLVEGGPPPTPLTLAL